MTKELIEEAREFLASENAQYYDSSLVRSLVDALEAATRVPVQGEPNDDREALAVQAYPDGEYTSVATNLAFREAFIRGYEARAAVPDAATEELANVKAGWDSALRIVNESNGIIKKLGAERDAALAEIESRIEDRDYWYGVAATAKDQRDAATELARQAEAELRDMLRVDIPSLKAERDAALAAVGRCRGVLASWRSVQASNREHFESGNPGMIVPIDCVGGLSAALDGAPEPEWGWEYGFELIELDDRNVFEREGDFISAAFAYRAAKKRIDEEYQADLPRLQYLIVRRRKAGPWLPVEGESKP